MASFTLTGMSLHPKYTTIISHLKSTYLFHSITLTLRKKKQKKTIHVNRTQQNNDCNLKVIIKSQIFVPVCGLEIRI